MNNKILIVTPYEGMYNQSRQIVNEKKWDHVDIVMGDVLIGLEKAMEEIQHHDYSLIISRGGTAELLIAQTSVPILEIPITTTDIMQSLKLSENYQGKVAIVGYPTITKKAKQVCELMDWHPTISTIGNKSKAEYVVDQLKEEGYTLVIGDVVTTSYCEQIGLESILIASSKDTLENTINQANLLVSSLHNSKLLTELCFGNQEKEHDFSLIYNYSGQLVLSSINMIEIQEEILNIINENFLDLSEATYYRKDIPIGKYHYSLTTKRLNVAEQFYLLIRIKKIDLYTDFLHGFKLFNKESLKTKYAPPSLSFWGDTRIKLQENINQTKPIIIVGERFTGKNACINHLFTNGERAEHLLYTFDCAKLTLETWYEALNFFKIKELKNESLYFVNLEAVSLGILAEIKGLLNDTLFRESNRFFFSYTQTNNSQTPLAEVTEQLFPNNQHVPIFLKPLKQAGSHLNNLVTIYLNDLNKSYGKNVVGLEDNGLNMLHDYPWPGNLQQFHRIIKTAVLKAQGYYISEANLASVIEEDIASGYDLAISDEQQHLSLNLNQSLNEIIYDIIEMTFHECDMNQTKTAEKLNVSRSTVWRTLKNGKQS